VDPLCLFNFIVFRKQNAPKVHINIWSCIPYIAVSSPVWVNKRSTMTGIVTSLPLTHCVKYGEHCLRHVPLRPVWSMVNIVYVSSFTHCTKYGENFHVFPLRRVWSTVNTVTSLPLTPCMKYGKHCHVTCPYALYEVWRTLSRHFSLRIVYGEYCHVTSFFTQCSPHIKRRRDHAIQPGY
jgi:hypothetical protein